LAVYAQPGPNPNRTVITKAEIDKISARNKPDTRDENARVVDIATAEHGLGIVHRSKQHVLTVGRLGSAAGGRGNAQRLRS